VLSFPRFYRQARKELLEEKSNIRREIEETILLLRETARRHTQAEKIKEGMFMRLIVRVVELITAFLRRSGGSRSVIRANRSGSRGQSSHCRRDGPNPGPCSQEPAVHTWSSLEGSNAELDDGRLFSPSQQSGLQGFYDPVPSCAKSLRIRYTFGGRLHYCEIPDYKPVVLPLGGKQSR
jgi:DnaJ family protein C protein 11